MLTTSPGFVLAYRLRGPEQTNSFQVCFILLIVDSGTSVKLFASK
jgi:hypothetical protein